ncbi:hypothetical protein [Vibrio alginolyticus]|uniref:hypothetical protein n=1 Tax=Vibrio alginolyticus TaxID=663 RepID=UPI00211A5334|nr:hypothetical protein [Vibrio alginolyticus]MCQ9087385.1 hypothetical protein [Vibrio alginolyticus]
MTDHAEIWKAVTKTDLGSLQNLEGKTASLELELHNELFRIKDSLGMIDHSIGVYGPRGHRGQRGLTDEQFNMTRSELAQSLGEECIKQIERDIRTIATLTAELISIAEKSKKQS